MRVIKENRVEEDGWQRIDTVEDPGVLPEGDLLVPLAVWKEHRDLLLERNGRTGVWLSGADDPGVLEEDLERLEIIALDFPVFKDGRSYSNARMLRDRFGFRGELRAVGDVLRDQVYFMRRCGIDSFQIREDKDIADALNGFADFTVTYQTAADKALPVYKRRIPD